jgi:hypothetical protein
MRNGCSRILMGTPPRRSSSFCASTSNRPKRQACVVCAGISTNHPSPIPSQRSLARSRQPQINGIDQGIAPCMRLQNRHFGADSQVIPE